MKRISWLFVLLILLPGLPAYSIAQPAGLTLLKGINVVTSVDNTRIELRFNSPPHEKGMIYQENFLQAELPNTYINPPKQWIKVEDGIVKDIFVYQFDPTTVKARFFTVRKAGDLKDKIKISKEDDKIIIQYPIASVVEKPSAKPVEAIPAANDENPPPLSPLPQGEGRLRDISMNPPPLMGGGEGAIGIPDIYASLLKMVLALCIVLSLLFIALFLFKKLFGKKIGMTGQNQGIRVITSAYIGPKKSIALIDISGERIVVGITPNHISMLTRLGKEGEFRDILKEQISSSDKVELHDELWEKV